MRSMSPYTRWNAQKPVNGQYMSGMVDLDHILFAWDSTRKKSSITCTKCKSCSYSLSSRALRSHKRPLVSHRCKKIGNLSVSASADDHVTVNGSPPASTSSSVETMRMRLDESLQTENYNDGLVQSLYDAARVFELSLKEQSSLSKMAWFSAAWIGMDHNAWVKALSYQASVYSLLQAANEISSHGDGLDGDISITVQRSLLRLSAPLESIIREKISAKQPVLQEWFWSEQVPIVVRTFVSHFERDPRFKAAAAINTSTQDCHGDASLVMLSLMCIASISKLGPAKVSCPQFYSMIPDVTGRLMDLLVDLIPMREAYRSVKDIGLHKEFLAHYGPRVTSCGIADDSRTDEVVFWVDLVQKQLQQAIDREKIWSRLTTLESIEVLERDLAIFGFFIALGRSSKSFLVANGFENLDGPLDNFVRYLISGCVLYYPQLSSISSYQLYVEVVCEELDWLVFYPGYADSLKRANGHKNKSERPPNVEAIPKMLEVCSYWISSFIKHSKWLDSPSHVKAAQFLSKGHDKLGEALELGIRISKSPKSQASTSFDRIVSNEDPGSFDKALESVEEALVKLESLLQELHVCSSSSEKEHLKAACSDLERIRKLKKEAEFLEASFRAKAASLQQVNDDGQTQSSLERRKIVGGKYKSDAASAPNSSNKSLGKSFGLWSFLVQPWTKKSENESAENLEDATHEAVKNSATFSSAESEVNEFQRFDLLRSELMELERRVQQSSNQHDNAEVTTDYSSSVAGTGLLVVRKDGSIIEKSFNKLKETSTDVWQGTQLLAIDVVAALGLLQRAMVGDELTEKEKQTLRRTLTDLASVIPIGVLMLLPVTAVGHAAMLAAIQRYAPGLIPSTYGSARLDLLRLLEKVKEMEAMDLKAEENVKNELV